MSDECGMMNENIRPLLPSFITHHSAFIVSTKHRLPLRVVGAEVFDCAVALVESPVEVVRRRFEFRGGLLESFRRRRLRAEFARLPRERLDLLDEREVAAI